MRTTIDVNEEILRRAKKMAADEGIPLKAIFERALREHLGRNTHGARDYRLRWHTEEGRALPGVDLDDRDRLLDLMDGRE